jgi:hypothetical protein
LKTMSHRIALHHSLSCIFISEFSDDDWLDACVHRSHPAPFESLDRNIQSVCFSRAAKSGETVLPRLRSLPPMWMNLFHRSHNGLNTYLHVRANSVVKLFRRELPRYDCSFQDVQDLESVNRMQENREIRPTPTFGHQRLEPKIQTVNTIRNSLRRNEKPEMFSMSKNDVINQWTFIKGLE